MYHNCLIVLLVFFYHVHTCEHLVHLRRVSILLVSHSRAFRFVSRYHFDDSPYTTDIYLEEGAAGNTDVDAMIVMDGISDARVSGR